MTPCPLPFLNTMKKRDWRNELSPVLSLFFLLLYFQLPASPVPIWEPKEIADSSFEYYFSKAQSLFYKHIDSTQTYLDSARGLALAKEDWQNYLRATFRKIDHNYIFEDLKESQKTLQSLDSLEQLEKLQAIPAEFWIQKDYLWGGYFRQLGYFEESLSVFEQCFERWKNLKGISKEKRCREIFKTKLFIAELYSKLGQYEEALSHYFANYYYFECYREVDLEKESPSYFATTYKLIGDTYLFKGEKNKALAYYKKAESDLLAIISQDGPENKWYFGWAKSIYRALTHAHIDNPIQARVYLDKLTSFQSKEDDSGWITIHKYASEIYAQEKKFDEAIEEMHRALKLSKNQYGEKLYDNGFYYFHLGELYLKANKPKAALEQFQEAIINFSLSFEKKNPAFLPTPDSIYAKKDMLAVLNQRQKALLAIYRNTGNSHYLELGRNTSELAIELIEQTRNSYWLEQDKEKLVLLSYEVYELAIEFHFLSGEKFHESAFEVSEKSKALTLLEAFRASTFSKAISEDSELIEKEKNIWRQIRYLENKFHQERTQKKPNSKKLSQTTESLHALRKEHTQIKNQLIELNKEADSSLWGQPLGVKRLQNTLIGPNQTLLEYFIGSREAYVFVINNDQFDLIKIDTAKRISNRIESYLKGLNGFFLATQPTDSLYKALNQTFLNSSWELYQDIILPISEKLQEKLIVIPDGLLNYIPFEALLEKSVANYSNNFRSLPYLLNTHEISYCYSATLLEEMDRKPKPSNNKLIAFAPSFPSQLPQNKLLASRRLRGNALDTLYNNINEVKALEKLFSQSRIYTHHSASKSNFLDHATEYTIIHIATHGVIEDSSSEDSFLAFTSIGDSVGNKLYVRDLYEIRLQAALVVISACDTGIGELRKGEGLISIARGFSYAGASSILTSLWSVNDSATAQIIQSYYQFLKEGASKPSALRQAKLAFISGQKDASEAHPFFWASFIQIGNREPIGTRWGVFELIIGILLVIILGILIGLYSKRKRQLKS